MISLYNFDEKINTNEATAKHRRNKKFVKNIIFLNYFVMLICAVLSISSCVFAYQFFTESLLKSVLFILFSIFWAFLVWKTGCDIREIYLLSKTEDDVFTLLQKQFIEMNKVEDGLKEENSPKLILALQLLGEGLQIIKEAIDMEHNNDLVSSDNAIMRFQALLPELFCCRSISEGFGAIINAIFHGLKNFNGKALNSEQLKKLHSTLERIYTEPFLKFDEAVEEINVLEKVGFIF